MLVPLYQQAEVDTEIQTLYERNTKRRTIKFYAGIATLAFAREPSAKAKKFKHDVTDTPGLEHTTSKGADRARCSASTIYFNFIRIYTDLTTKLLKIKGKYLRHIFVHICLMFSRVVFDLLTK